MPGHQLRAWERRGEEPMSTIVQSFAGLRLILRLNGDLVMVVLAIVLGLAAGAGLASLVPTAP